MSSLLYYLSDDYWDSIQHNDTGDLLPGGPKWVLLTLFTYILFIYKIGPNFMKSRQPYNLKTTIKIYNIINIALNAFYVITTIISPNFGFQILTCEATCERWELVFIMYVYLGLKVRVVLSVCLII